MRRRLCCWALWQVDAEPLFSAASAPLHVPSGDAKYLYSRGPTSPWHIAMPSGVGAYPITSQRKPIGPTLLCVALALWLNLHLPVFQERPSLGLSDLSFGMIKFLFFYQHEEGHRRTTLTLSGRESIFSKLENALRNTRVGRVLRRWRLHEMPQLLNMLVGDKSLVDLRPALARRCSSLSFSRPCALLSAARHHAVLASLGSCQSEFRSNDRA